MYQSQKGKYYMSLLTDNVRADLIEVHETGTDERENHTFTDKDIAELLDAHETALLTILAGEDTVPAAWLYFHNRQRPSLTVELVEPESGTDVPTDVSWKKPLYTIAVTVKAVLREREAMSIDWMAVMREGGLVTRGDADTLGDRVVDTIRARTQGRHLNDHTN